MRLWSLILLSFLCTGLRAGEEAVAPATTTPAPVTSAPASTTSAVEAVKPAVATKPTETAPTYTAYRLTNTLVSVEVIDRQGAIRQLDLLQTHPVRLHAWQIKAQEAKQQTVLDPAKPLPVLGAFNPAGSYHNWLEGIGLSNKTLWKKISGDDTHLVLSHETAEARWTLRYDLPADSLALKSTLTIENLGKADLTLRPVIYPLNGVHQDDVKQDAAYLALVHHNGGSTGKMTSLYLPPVPSAGYPATPTPIPANQLDYVSLKSRFFGSLWHPLGHRVVDPTTLPVALVPAAAAPLTPAEGGPGGGGPGGPQAVAAPALGAAMQVQGVGFKDVNGGHQAYVEVKLLAQGGGDIVVKPTQRFEAMWTLTAASMNERDLTLIGQPAAQVEFSDGYFRFFKSLVWPLTWVLDKLVLLVLNYGVAVVVLTFLIKLALHRTTFKQHESMMKMQKLAPELKLLQEQYKTDKQKMAQKQMELWKKHGVNPLGGCLPILIQIPIFTALFLAFSHSADMRGAGFLWINDLTLPDQLIGWVIGGWTISINPLPIIYIGVSIWMSLMQKVPPGADPQQEQMMKMMRWLPVLFGVIFYNFPSGLVLYFTINAVLSTIEIKMVRKKLGMN